MQAGRLCGNKSIVGSESFSYFVGQSSWLANSCRRGKITHSVMQVKNYRSFMQIDRQGERQATRQGGREGERYEGRQTGNSGEAPEHTKSRPSVQTPAFGDAGNVPVSPSLPCATLVSPGLFLVSCHSPIRPPLRSLHCTVHIHALTSL